MKILQRPSTLSILFLLFFYLNSFCQYSETFSIPNKGILSGCNGTEASCTSDFAGVNWTINGDFSGMDSNDFISTDGSVLTFSDVDAEMCFESPVLNISAVTGNFSFSIDVVYEGHDMEDYVDVEYQIDGGSWVQIPNILGGGTHTIDFATVGNSGSTTVNQTGLSGSSTLSIRVCLYINLFVPFEFTTIDNLTVPETGVTVLPVELISFKAKKSKNDIIELNWSTATETNNEKFEIEHSNSGKDFKKIGEVIGKGTSVEINQYSFMHEKPTTGRNYYRLKQIDFDGQFEYSKVTSVYIETSETNMGDFYPNPTQDGVVHLNYTSVKKSDLTLSVFDAMGSHVLDQQVDFIKGEHQLNFDFSKLRNGIYLVRLENQGNLVYRKLIINRAF